MTNITPTLETARLILRPVTINDAPDVQRLFPHWEIVKYMANRVPWPYPHDGAQKFYNEILLPNVESGVTLGWGVTLRENGTFIGALQITPRDYKDNRGFWIARPFWNQGYISEAVSATTDYAFDRLQLPLLQMSNAAPNLASRRIKEKAGAILVETSEDNFIGGRFPKHVWRLTPDAWRTSPMKRAAADPSYRLR